MPSNNQHRGKIKKINQILNKADMMMMTETGSKKKDQSWTCHDEYEIVKENKVQNEKKGVLICGKGTIMTARKNIVT